jgi:hypothetical protein
MNKQEIEKAIEFINELMSDNKEDLLFNNKIGATIKTALAQQLNNGWIPCSERNPEFDQNCLVTTDSEEIFTSKFYGYGEECQGYREYPEGVWEINQCELEVIAWRPLPEPYKEAL